MKLRALILPIFLAAGCGQTLEVLPTEAALFCDLAEPRRFSQAEIDWRSANAPWNLTKDFTTNINFERECEPDE